MGRAPADGPWPPVPVAIVGGADPAARGRLLRRWLRERSPGERWLRVGDPAVFAQPPAGTGDTPPDAPSGTPPGASAGRAAPDTVALAGCACCAALPALRAGLARALRAARPDRILVDADARADLPALVDALRTPPFDALLDVDAVAVVVDPARDLPRPDAGDPSRRPARVRTRIGCADAIVAPAAAAPDALRSLACLAAPPGWPAGWLPAALVEDAAGGVPLDAVRPRAAAPHAPGAREAPPAGPDAPDAPDTPDPIVAPDAPDATDLGSSGEPSGACALVIRWPPSTRFDRRALVALFARWAGDPAVRSARGVFRTERAWYACQALGGVADCDESPRRRDSRCVVLADASFDRTSARAALAVALGDPGTP